MAADVQMSLFSLFLSEWVHRYLALNLSRLELQDYSMHSVYRSRLVGLREKLFASDGARDDIANKGIALGQVSREIHFFPFVALLDAQSRKAEVASNSVGSYEVDLAVYWFNIDIIWVFFL
jgi:hypothetical protein